jgi:inhibitor of KinA sporulation pathway (predicted exonuclease)/RNA:NAD 2'-phosphotransferase (TPT1/KptA family)
MAHSHTDSAREATRLSKALTLVLRHRAIELGIDVRPDGFMRLSQVLASKPLSRFRKTLRDSETHSQSATSSTLSSSSSSTSTSTLKQIQSIVTNCSKQRFSLIVEDNIWYIRANQGHSGALKSILNDDDMLHRITLSEVKSINHCVHGTYMNVWEPIKQKGLCRMARKHIHMSSAEFGSSDMISGMRSDCQILIHIDIQSAIHDGIPFYMSANRVILSPGIGQNGYLPPKYFSRVERLNNRRVVGTLDVNTASASSSSSQQFSHVVTLCVDSESFVSDHIDQHTGIVSQRRQWIITSVHAAVLPTALDSKEIGASVDPPMFHQTLIHDTATATATATATDSKAPCNETSEPVDSLTDTSSSSPSSSSPCSFEQCMERFENFLVECKLWDAATCAPISKKPFMIVASSDLVIQRDIAQAFRKHHLPIPPYFRKWTTLKTLYRCVNPRAKKKVSVPAMLTQIGLSQDEISDTQHRLRKAVRSLIRQHALVEASSQLKIPKSQQPKSAAAAAAAAYKTTVKNEESKASVSAFDQLLVDEQPLDYLLVLDFEATCDDDRKFRPQEVIEFPIVCVDTKTLKCETLFHRYVRPITNRKLTKFCTKLTGITQEVVDSSKPFSNILDELYQCLFNNGFIHCPGALPVAASSSAATSTETATLPPGYDGPFEPTNKRFAFVTCGDWDLKTMLPKQCALIDRPVPGFMRKWINIKRPFGTYSKTSGRTGMAGMLHHMGMELVGHHHSGIDDSHNISRIAVQLIKAHIPMIPNGEWKPKHARLK